jgi:hypothetical protein
VAWQWANAKIEKESLIFFKQTIHISKEDMEDYNLVMFTHAMDFFNKCTSLKKSILDVVVMPFGVVLAYPIVPKSPLPSKWSNQKQIYHIKT